MEFYSERDLHENEAQTRGVLLRLVFPSAVLLAALIASLWVRWQWATVLVTVLWGGLLIFSWGMKIAPLRAYRRYLMELFAGARRSAEGVVVSFSEEEAYKEGVLFFALLINTDTKQDPMGESLYYVDRCKPRPALAPGDVVRITSWGNFMTAWEVLEDRNVDG